MENTKMLCRTTLFRLWRICTAIVASMLLLHSGHIQAEASVWQADDAGGRGDIEYSKDRIIVKFKESVGASVLASDAEATRNAGVSLEKNLERTGLAVYRVTADDADIPQIVEALGKLQSVEYAEPDYIVRIDATPNDPRYPELWGMDNTGQTGGANDADIDAPEAWSIETGSRGIIVAVVDSGVDYTHGDLSANMWRNTAELNGIEGVDDDGNGYVDDVHGIDTYNDDSDPMDDNGHGTHVAGTIGGWGNNGSGVAGVNWEISIMALKFTDAWGYGATSDAVAALDYILSMKVDHGHYIKLTNNSWGGYGYSQALFDAIQAAENAGLLFVASAGNYYGGDNDASPHYPSSYELDSIIAVASSDHNDEMSNFSNYGAASVDLAAPGSDILSTLPGDTYGSKNGTSMAAPHVTGAAALLWANSPSLSPSDVKQTLISTVDLVPAFENRVVSDGRLNIYNALTCDPGYVSLRPSLSPGFSLYADEPTEVTAVLTACARLTGATLTVNFSNGDTSLPLLDDGIAPDLIANDGRYTANWTPVNAGPVTVDFQAQYGGSNYNESRTGTVVERFNYQMDDRYPFDWYDISQTGTPMQFTHQRHHFPVDFDFNFYGNDYSQIAVGFDGTLYFENEYMSSYNRSIPSDTYGVNTFIALYWDVFDPGAGGEVLYQVIGSVPRRRLIVQWDQVKQYSDGGTGSFQIILFEENGDILMQYLDVQLDGWNDAGVSATIGLQESSDWGHQYSYNTAALRDNMAILWSTQDCDGAVPGATELISPSGSITDNTPEFIWFASRCASSYHLYVDDSNGNMIDWQYQADDVCGGLICTISSPVALADGDGQWWVRPRNAVGDGDWSDPLSFTLDLAVPGRPELISPSGTISSTEPTFSWKPIDLADSYLLLVNDSSVSVQHVTHWYTAEEAGCADGISTCSVTPGIELNPGTAVWWVKAGNRSGTGPLSDPMTFTISGITAPGTATLVSPNASILDLTPTYTWNAEPSSTWYMLWVNDQGGKLFAKWYTREEAGCESGTGTCSVTPEHTLKTGDNTWWIRTWNAAGAGDWSAGMSFSTLAPPADAILLAPEGAISDSTPVYTWNAAADATWYLLWVQGPSGVVLNKWYSAEGAGCEAGTGTCEVIPDTGLEGGFHTWWVRTWNQAGQGPWSAPMSFNVDGTPPPLASSPISPTGSITSSTPTYEWTEVSGSTWYYLWVNNASGTPVVQEWFTAADANCSAGSCSVTPGTSLADGNHSWWIQTWNSSGIGPWSNPASFSVVAN